MTLPAIAFGQVDLTSCDREPIHIPGSIQPHGVLLVVERRSERVVQYAGNVALLLGTEPQRLLQCTLTDLFKHPDLAKQLRAPTLSAEPVLLQELETCHGHLPLSATVHAQGELAIIELEPKLGSDADSANPLAQVTIMLAALQSARAVQACCQAAAAQVRATIGFDRVMVYQFLHDGSGKVMAEDKADTLDSFLGLHYPASDIPQQARALYRRNWLRHIPDINYTPAPLTPALLEHAGTPLDMSHCALRSISPLHLEYLRNMGVGATLTLSIMIGNELWGLVACHNTAPRHLAVDLRIACELFAQLLSMQLDTRIELAAARRRIDAQNAHAVLARNLPMDGDIAAGLVGGPVTLLDLIPAGGVAIWLDGKLHTLGQTPPFDVIVSLLAWLSGLAQPLVESFQLGTLFAPAIPWSASASGLLAVSLSRDPQDYVIWFRPEVISSVTWAGDPSKPVEPGVHGTRLTPRKSFAAWEAEVRQQSTPWDLVDIETAHAFRLSLLETVLRQMDLARQERAAAFSRQSMLMAELDHRVKNTLANIQALVRQTKGGAGTLEDFALGLEMRIRAMARAHDLLGAAGRTDVSVRAMVEEEMAPYWTTSNTSNTSNTPNNQSRIAGADLMLSSKAAMPFTMVMHELISNAAKYGALSNATGSVDIAWTRTAGAGDLVLTWQERNGPPVAAPTRRGFGSVVIERSLRHELKGHGVLTFHPEGVGCILTIPAAYVVADDTDKAAHV